MPQAAGQLKVLLFLVKIKVFRIYANIFSDAGQVPIFRYFEAGTYISVDLAHHEICRIKVGKGGISTKISCNAHIYQSSINHTCKTECQQPYAIIIYM